MGTRNCTTTGCRFLAAAGSPEKSGTWGRAGARGAQMMGWSAAKCSNMHTCIHIGMHSTGRLPTNAKHVAAAPKCAREAVGQAAGGTGGGGSPCCPTVRAGDPAAGPRRSAGSTRQERPPAAWRCPECRRQGRASRARCRCRCRSPPASPYGTGRRRRCRQRPCESGALLTAACRGSRRCWIYGLNV